MSQLSYKGTRFLSSVSYFSIAGRYNRLKDKKCECLLQVKTRDGIISYTLKLSSRRKTVAILLDKHARIKVYSPRFVGKEEVERFIREKSSWILKKIRQIEQANCLRRRHKFVDGEKYLFLGKQYPLKIISQQCPRPKITFDLAGWTVYIPLSLVDSQREKVMKEQIIQWYRRQACEMLGSRVLHFCRIMDLAPLKISVRTQKRIWGSCHHFQKAIHLNWKIIMAPVEVIDYVIVHELAHMKIPNHSARFWREVNKVVPDFKRRKQWLKKHSSSLILE